jgi:hypothetical protein
MQEIERLPTVVAWARLDVVSGGFVLPDGRFLTQPQLFGIADLRGTFFTTLGRAKVLSGRMYHADASNEAVVDFASAERVGLRVGEVLRATVGDPFAQPRRTVPVRIVGIVAHPRVFPAFGANSVVSTLELSPAFAPTHRVTPDPALASLELRVKGGAAGVPAFMAQMRRSGLAGFDIPFVQAVRTAGVQRSTTIEADALWALACVMVLAAGAVLGQALSRQTSLSSTDFGALRAVGMSRRQLFALGLTRAAMTGAVGAVVAMVLAFAFSPLTPIGLARVADPTPGFAFDVLGLPIGAIVVLVFTVVLAAIPAWRAAHRAAVSVDAADSPSILAGIATRAAPSPVVGAGIRMALEPGRGRTAVPVRSAILGATLAIATLIAALTFWSSLQHLVSTPRLSGFVWDLFASPPTDADGHPVPAGLARIDAVLKADRNVAGYSRGTVITLQIDGRAVFALITSGTGPVAPVVVAGRAPTASDEIVLGRVSMRQAGVQIGGTVRVGVAGAGGTDPPPPSPRTMRVVGEVIAPTSLFSESEVGDGAAITIAAGVRLVGQQFTREMVDGLAYLIRFRDGVQTQAEVNRLLARFPDGTYSSPSAHRGDISTLGRITEVPLVFALLLGALALATLAQTLITSVRARRRDLAILKTLGFSRRQIRGLVAWQASTLVAVALAFGLPLGLLAGRWIWRAFAGGIAVVPRPTLSPWWFPAAVVATLVLANLIAAIPARTAARTRPAVILRSE